MIRYLSKTDPKKLRGTALLRLDFNTEDSWRLEATLPTVRFLAKYADAILIMSHKRRPVVELVGGTPKGPDVRRYSQRKDAATLSRLLRKPVTFIPHFRFGEILETMTTAPKGSIFVLENIRFHPGEGTNDMEFARELAALADYYVNEAFPNSHRADASMVAITKCLPSYGGFLLEKEIRVLGGKLDNPQRPFVVLLGGGKAKDKLAIIERFKHRVDWFLLGGAAANTLLKMLGVDIGASITEYNPKDEPMLRKTARYRNVLLPEDWLVEKGKILDIGPGATRAYAAKLKGARTILWSGPMGLIERKKFAVATLSLAKVIAKNRKAFSVTGGGETVMFLRKHKLDRKFSFISTGGGAMIEFLSGKKLPGIEALK